MREIPFLFSGNLPRLLLRISLAPFNLGYTAGRSRRRPAGAGGALPRDK